MPVDECIIQKCLSHHTKQNKYYLFKSKSHIYLRDKNNFAGWNDELNNAYFKRELVFDNTTNTYFYEVGDGTHPNIKGYDRFYVPVIEEKLISLSK